MVRCFNRRNNIHFFGIFGSPLLFWSFGSGAHSFCLTCLMLILSSSCVLQFAYSDTSSIACFSPCSTFSKTSSMCFRSSYGSFRTISSRLLTFWDPPVVWFRVFMNSWARCSWVTCFRIRFVLFPVNGVDSLELAFVVCAG